MRYSLLAIIALTVSGCGTMANVQGKKYFLISNPGEEPVRIYGGVRKDIEYFLHFGEDDSSEPFSPTELAFWTPVFAYFAVVDPVLSFVGDTVTLPYVIKLNHDVAGERRSTQVDAGD